MEQLHKYKVAAIDTETTGLRYPVDHAFGFSLATPAGSWYWDIRHERRAIEGVVAELQKFDGVIVCHNVSFDYRMMLSAGFKLPLDKMDDTVVRAAQINEHEHSFELDHLAKKYLGREKDITIYRRMADLFGGLATRNVQMKRIKHAPPEVVEPYACLDAELCLALYMWQEEEIVRQSGHHDLRPILEFERMLMPEFIENEVTGIRVDIDKAVQAAEHAGEAMVPLQAELDQIFGEDVNPDSSPQIKKLFDPYEKEGEWYVREEKREFRVGKTPKGGPSLKAEFMLAMADAGSRAAELIVQLRSLRKTKDTFLLGHVVGHNHGGRVYPNINQSKGEVGGTGTGRLSYTNPALQQIPSRIKSIAAVVKDVFLPEEGHVWVDYDLDGFEVLVFAHLINHPAIIEAYRHDRHLDLHQYVADITGLPRNPPRGGAPNGKQLNLSMIFNQGKGATAEKMGLPWEWSSFKARDGAEIRFKKAGPEAERIIETYHRRVPGVRELINKCREYAEYFGYIRTATGRRIRFPRGYKTYKASGLMIQATAADINKKNWIRIREALDPLGGRLLLNTHDSYGTSVPEEHALSGLAQRMTKEAVEDSAGLRVPLTLSCSGYGATWWDAVKGDG